MLVSLAGLSTIYYKGLMMSDDYDQKILDMHVSAIDKTAILDSPITHKEKEYIESRIPDFRFMMPFHLTLALLLKIERLEKRVAELESSDG